MGQAFSWRKTLPTLNREIVLEGMYDVREASPGRGEGWGFGPPQPFIASLPSIRIKRS